MRPQDSFLENLSDSDAVWLQDFLQQVNSLRVVDAQRWKDLLCTVKDTPQGSRIPFIRQLLWARLQGTQDPGLIKGLYRAYVTDDASFVEFTLALAHALLDCTPAISVESIFDIFRPVYRERELRQEGREDAEQLLSRLESWETYDSRVVFFASALVGWSLQLERCLGLLLKQIESLPTDSALRYPLIRWVNYALNIDSDNCGHFRGRTRALYDSALDSFTDLARKTNPNRDKQKPVLLVAFSAFWDYKNAPTWIIFNYLRDMAARYPTITIHILNTDTRIYPTKLFAWIAPAFMNRRVINPEEKAWQETFFAGLANIHLHYWSDHYPMDTADGWDSGLPALIDYVAELSPDLMMVVHYELLGQAFLGSIPTIHYPMTTIFTDWLKTDCQIYWGHAPLSEVYGEKGPPIPIDRIGVQRLGVNPSYGDNHVYQREELNLPPGATVVVSIGTRLDREITEDIARQMMAILKSHPDACWLLVGTRATIPAIAIMDAVKDRVIVRTFDPHVEAIYEHCDIYLNPPRPGGGFSAAMAMFHHVPVLNVGASSDVGMYLDQEFNDDNLTDMIKRLGTWLCNEELRGMAAEKQRERLLSEFSVEKAVDSLLPILGNTITRFWKEKGETTPPWCDDLISKTLNETMP